MWDFCIYMYSIWTTVYNQEKIVFFYVDYSFTETTYR